MASESQLSRKQHKKSHHGCRTCKTRKVKCDELRPSCSNCTRRAEHCSYPGTTRFITSSAAWPQGYPMPPPYAEGVFSFPQSLIPSFGISLLSTSPNSSFFSVPSNPTSPSTSTDSSTTTWCTDLSLMHHYTNTTWKTLSDREDLNAIWRDIVPQFASSYPWLMHAVLAVSALHFSYTLQTPSSASASYRPDLTPSQSTSLGIKHYNSALLAVQPVLQNPSDTITPSNASALFTFTSLGVVVALATPHAAAGGVGSQLADPLSDFADVVNLLRGVHAVLGVTWEWVRKGPIKPLLATRDYNASAARQLPEDALPAFQLLRAKIAKAWPLDETEPAEDLSPNPRNNGQDDGNLGKDYHFACRRLEIALMDVRERPGDRIALAWPVVISKTFVKEFKEGKALALVLLAFYGAILHDLKDSWWMGSWGRQIVKRVAKDLEGGEWDEVLLWPLQIVGEGE